MSAQPRLHRGHSALLDIVRDGPECTATIRNGMVSFDHNSQDFLQSWYDDPKRCCLIHAEDWLEKPGELGEKVTITEAGVDALQQN